MLKSVSYLFLLVLIGYSRLPGAFEIHASGNPPILFTNALYIGSPLLSGLLSSALFRDKSTRASFAAGWRNQFGLSEMNCYIGQAAWYWRDWQIGLGGSVLGAVTMYREQVSETTALFNLSNRLTLGAGLGRYAVSVKNYGSVVGYGGNIAWSLRLDDKIYWTTYLHNVLIFGSSDLSAELPRVVSTSVYILAGDDLVATCKWEQDSAYSGRLGFGTAWRISPWFSIMAGYSAQPAQIQAGLGFNITRLNIGYTAITHQHLGVSQFVAVGVNLAR